MKIEYLQYNDINKNKNNETIKTIFEEIDRIYYLSNSSDNSAKDIKKIYKKIFLIRDLSFIYKKEKIVYEKSNENLDVKTKEETIQNINQIHEEMNNILNEIKEKENQDKKNPIIDFLIKYAENNSIY